MEQKETVKLFIENGFQISNNILEKVSKNPEKIIKKLKTLKPRPFIITEKYLEKIMEEEETQIKIIKRFFFDEKEMRVGDYTKLFLLRYDKIKNILSKNKSLDKLISINRLDGMGEFSIIGIVREKDKKKLLVEDPTGETHVFLKDENKLKNIILDSVLGFKCKKDGNVYYIEKLIYPDISLAREITKASKKMKIMIISNPSILKGDNYKKLTNFIKITKNLFSIFVFGGWIDEEKIKEFNTHDIFTVSDDCKITLLKIEKIKILLIPKGIAENYNSLLYLLINRSIFSFDPKNQKNIDFILEDIPDILITNINQTFFKNYKGTTIVSISNPKKNFIIDLNTREIEENVL